MSAWSDYVAAIPDLWAWWRMNDLTDSSGNGRTLTTAGNITDASVATSLGLGLLPFDQDGAQVFPASANLGQGVWLNSPALGMTSTQWTFFEIFSTTDTRVQQNNAVVRMGQYTYQSSSGAQYIWPWWQLSAAAASGTTIRTMTSAGYSDLPSGGTPTAVNDGNPHLYVVRSDGTSGVQGLVDLAPGSVAATSFSPGPLSSLSINGGTNGSAWTFSGRHDEFGVVAHYMTDQEIADLWAAYNQPPAPQGNPNTYPNAVRSTPFLRHYWRMGAIPLVDEVGGLTLNPSGNYPAPTVGPGLVADDDGAIVQPGGSVGNVQQFVAPLGAIGTQWSFVCICHPLGNSSTQVPNVFAFPPKTLPVGGGQNRANFLLNQAPYPSMNSSFDDGSATTGGAVYTSFLQYGAVDDRTFWWAGTWDGQYFRYYIDGIQVPFQVSGGGATTAGISGTPTQAALDPLVMRADGGTIQLLSPNLGGTYDEVALWSRALTADEVAALFAAIVVPNYPSAPATVTAYAGVRSCVVTWTAPTSTGGTGATITGYNVRYTDPGGAQRTISRTATQLSLSVSAVPGASYQFAVSAINQGGEGPATVSNVVVPRYSRGTTTTFRDRVLAIPDLAAYWRFGTTMFEDLVGGRTLATSGAGTVASAPGLLPYDADPAVQVQSSPTLQASGAATSYPAYSVMGIYALSPAPASGVVRRLFNGNGFSQTFIMGNPSTLPFGCYLQWNWTVAALAPNSSVVNVCDGSPHFWVETFDGTTACLYWDGVLQNSTTNNSNSSLGSANLASVAINGGNNASTDSLVLDETAVVARAISAQEVSDLWIAFNTAPRAEVLTYPRAILSTPGLRHYWRLGGSGPTWADQVGGTAFSITAGQPQPTTGLVGDDDGALSLAVLARLASAAFIENLGANWSLSLLLQLPSLPPSSNWTLWSFANTGMNGPFGATNVNGDSATYNGIGWGPAPANGGLKDLKPHHWVITSDGARINSYLDGRNIGIATATIPIPAGASLYIGIGGSNTPAVTFDEVAIFDRALSSIEVRQLYNAMPISPTSDAPQITAKAGLRSALLGVTQQPQYVGTSGISRYVVEWDK